MEDYVLLKGRRDQKVFINRKHIVGLSEASDDVTAVFTVSETFTIHSPIGEVLKLIGID